MSSDVYDAFSSLLHGCKGNRTAFASAAFTLTPLYSLEEGENLTEQINRDQKELVAFLSEDTQLSAEYIQKDMELGLSFDAMQAKEYGLIDRIIQR